MNKEEAKKQIDEVINRLEWRHGGGTDYVKNDRTTAHAIIDKIEPDHPKVKLPREVGEELEDYQDEDIDLLDYLHDVIDSKELRATRVWMLGDCEQLIGILADAYRYGWTAEPEAKWYVKTPDSWNGPACEYPWVVIDRTGEGLDRASKRNNDPRYRFTRTELEKYGLDSPIFTLVPAEDNKHD